MIIPGLLFFVIFKYVPMYGIIIAFKDFRISRGVFASPWVGLKHFQRFFSSPDFSQVMINTTIISLYKLLIGFPIPILFAILLNEIRSIYFKRTVQTIAYLPHFISWVVIGNLVLILLSPKTGLISSMITAVSGIQVNLLMDPKYFRGVLVVSDIWKEMGWSAIVYLAALAGVDPTLYEAADIDGASRGRKMWSITLPSITNVILIMLILRVGRILDAGFEQVLIISNPLVNSVAEIIDTYVYKMGMLQAEYSYSTAVNLFKSVVGLIMVLFVNFLAKKWEG
ncbi:MAG: ABC transporter permease subunit [Treponema sp.]|nr:ABC transporter permease subunit [Treponema sp.]